jgi:hypothetical protein
LLLEIEAKKKLGIITPGTVALGIARAGSDNPVLKADFLKDLVNFDFGEPPFSLIIPGDLHFMEVDALIAFAGAPKEFKRLSDEHEALAAKYIDSAEKVLAKLKRQPTPITIDEATVSEVLRWAVDYLADAKYYKAQGKLETSLTSVAYCEGLLDGLRLMGAVNFVWPTKQEKAKSSSCFRRL